MFIDILVLTFVVAMIWLMLAAGLTYLIDKIGRCRLHNHCKWLD